MATCAARVLDAAPVAPVSSDPAPGEGRESRPAVLSCRNGHGVEPGFSYCPTCGAALGPAAETPTRQTHPTSTATATVTVTANSEQRALSRYRTWIVVALLVALVVVVLLVVDVVGTGATPSWKDGYAAGQQVWDGEAAAHGSATSVCARAAESPVFKASDDRSQWLAGCSAGYSAASKVGAS